MAKIIVDWDLCDGNGLCAVEAPAVFEMTDDDDLIVLQEDVAAAEESHARAAARACPKRAIVLG
jgi:ferredoxin